MLRSSCKVSRHFRAISTRFGASRQIFIKVSNIKLHENPSSGNRADRCEQMGMTKLIGTFRDYANALKHRRFGELFCFHRHVWWRNRSPSKTQAKNTTAARHTRCYVLARNSYYDQTNLATNAEAKYLHCNNEYNWQCNSMHQYNIARQAMNV
jgi:hypothetical protein